jgi:ABC-2 type transport system permease protein
MSELPRETVFVSPGNGNADAFNRHHPATKDLQEVLLLFPGYLLPMESSLFSFEPLLQTGRLSGSSSFFDVVRPTPNGLALNMGLTREPDKRQYVMAAQVRSKQAEPQNSSAGTPVNLVIVADLDFISDYFFDVRITAPVNVSFDNITFFLNSIDVIAGDQSFIALRSRHARHRTLERIEARTRTFLERRTREEQKAEQDAQIALSDARNHLRKRVDEIERRRDLDAQEKQMMARNLQESENRRLKILESSIDQEKNQKIQASRDDMEAQVRSIRSRIRMVAVLLPPVPVFLVGITLLVRRKHREREGAGTMYRLRENDV